MNFAQGLLSPFKELSGSWDLMKVLTKDGRKCIVTPPADPNLSPEQNYQRQFETRIAFDGDIINFVPRMEAYSSAAAWKAMSDQHQQNIMAYMDQLGNFNGVTTLLGALLSLGGAWSSAEWIFEAYDWKSLAVAVATGVLIWVGRKVIYKLIFALLRTWLTAKTGLKRLIP